MIKYHHKRKRQGYCKRNVALKPEVQPFGPKFCCGGGSFQFAVIASQPRSSGYGYDRGYGYSEPQRCHDCGRIERIEVVYGARDNSRTGAILGGLVGAVAARESPQHGSQGNTNTATGAGAVAASS